MIQREIIFAVLVVCLLLLVASKQLFPNIFSGMSNIDYFRNLNLNFDFFHVFITISFSLALSLGVSLIQELPLYPTLYLWQASFISLFVLFLSFSITRYLVIYSFFHSVDSLSKMDKVIQLKSFFRFWQLVVIIIMVAIYFYAPLPFDKSWLVWILFAAIGILFMAEIVFLLLTYRKDKGNEIPVFHIILYLCILEILPLIVIVKALFYE